MKVRNYRSLFLTVLSCTSIGLCLVAVPMCDNSIKRSENSRSEHCTICPTSTAQDEVFIEQVLSPKKSRVFTKEKIEAQLQAFDKAIDQACKKCSLCNCVPNWFLSDMDKRRLKLCPRLNEMKKNRSVLLSTLLTDESIAYMNDIVEEYKNMLAKKPRDLTRHDREHLFHDILDVQHEQDITHAHSMALGFLYWWVFRCNALLD